MRRILFARRAIVACAAVFVLAAPAAAQTPPSSTGFFSGISDVASLRRMVEEAVVRSDEHLDALLKVEGRRSVENTLVPFDRMVMELSNASGTAGVIARLHPDEAMQLAAQQLAVDVGARATSLGLREDIYRAIKAIDVQADPLARRYVDTIVRSAELNGVNKAEDVRARLKTVREELQRLQQEFQRNLQQRRTITITRAEAEGLPADFIAARQSADRATVTLSTDQVDATPVMTFANNADVRRRLLMERLNLAVPENVALLERILAARHELATLLGFADWADYHAQPRMAGSGKAVADFIDRVFAATRQAADRDYQQLLARKRADDPSATVVNQWDSAFYGERLRQEQYAFDSQSVRPYFAFERVRTGVMEVASRLFDISFRRAALPAWHDSVERYDVLQDGVVIGRLYLDLHPRARKANSGASVAAVRRGVAGVQLQESVLTASVSGGIAGDPGLMTHAEVRTLFHEFGHVVHGMVSGRGRWFGLARPEESDVIEAPSTMMEEWIWDAKALATFARHYQTDQPIPESLVAQMRRAGEFGRAMAAQQSVYLSAYAFAMHSGNPAGRETTAVGRATALKYSPVPWVEGGHRQAQWTHLANPNYTSSYYTYEWSQVIAKDLFTKFDRSNLLDPGPARRYRDLLLAPGGTKPAAELIEDFLGRPFNFAAYERWLNGDS